MTTTKAIRLNCLECSGESSKGVAYCPCDGVHSTWCQFWPYRFGCRPETAQARYGDQFVTPGALPGPDVPLEELPTPSPKRRKGGVSDPEAEALAVG